MADSINKVIIQISGPEHVGKTTLSVLLARFLEDHGATVHLQAQHQLAKKTRKETDELAKRLQGLEFLIMEMQTAPVINKPLDAGPPPDNA